MPGLVFLLDEDLASRSIVATLRDHGLKVRTVPEENLSWRSCETSSFYSPGILNSSGMSLRSLA